MSLDAGDFSADQCSLGDAECDFSAGDCALSECTVGSCRIDSSAGDVTMDLKGGRSRQILRVKERVCELDSCSACYGTLIPVLHRLEQEGLLERLPHRLCIGQGYRGKTGSVGIGNCTAAFDVSLPGCPPAAEEMERFLRSIAGSLDV